MFTVIKVKHQNSVKVRSYTITIVQLCTLKKAEETAIKSES